MKLMKRTLGLLLALMMIVSIPAAAFADTYDIANGEINVRATADKQTVTQKGTNIQNQSDSAPVITGSSETNFVFVSAGEGSTAEVTLKDVTAGYLGVYGEGDATITVEGSNTINSDNVAPAINVANYGTTTFEGSGSLEGNASNSAITIYADVVVDGPDITGNGGNTGVVISPRPREDKPVVTTVESGSLTGTVSDGKENGHMSEDGVNTAGIHVFEDATLAVNGGTVTGTNENEGLPGQNPGIGFEDGASLKLGNGIAVYDADGKDVTDAAKADPTVLNNSAKTTINAAPASAPVRTIASAALQEIVSTVKNADGEEVSAKVNVKMFDNNNFIISVISDAGSEDMYGSFSLKDGELVFTYRGVEYKLTADNVLILPLRNGGTVEVQLTAEVIELLLSIL